MKNIFMSSSKLTICFKTFYLMAKHSSELVLETKLRWLFSTKMSSKRCWCLILINSFNSLLNNYYVPGTDSGQKTINKQINKKKLSEWKVLLYIGNQNRMTPYWWVHYFRLDVKAFRLRSTDNEPAMKKIREEHFRQRQQLIKRPFHQEWNLDVQGRETKLEDKERLVNNEVREVDRNHITGHLCLIDLTP